MRIFLALIITFSLCACGDGGTSKGNASSGADTVSVNGAVIGVDSVSKMTIESIEITVIKDTTDID